MPNFLPKDFVPGPNDILLGRGKKCYKHVGNINFLNLVASKLDEYSAASTKLDKSQIIASVVSTIQEQSSNGGFLKQDTSTGLWYEAGDFLARERTSQAFRDALQANYRSSSAFKKKSRQLKSKPRPKKSTSKAGVDLLPKINVEETSSDQSIEPLPILFDEMLDEVNLAEVDVDLSDINLEIDDQDDLASTCSSLCFNDSNNLEAAFNMGDLEPCPILEKPMPSFVFKMPMRGMKSKSALGREKSFSGFSSMPRRSTAAAFAA